MPLPPQPVLGLVIPPRIAPVTPQGYPAAAPPRPVALTFSKTLIHTVPSGHSPAATTSLALFYAYYGVDLSSEFSAAERIDPPSI